MGIFDGILILSDFDGTFAGEGGRIIDRNILAIEYFRANGGHFSVFHRKTAVGNVEDLPGFPHGFECAADNVQRSACIRTVGGKDPS